MSGRSRRHLRSPAGAAGARLTPALLLGVCVVSHVVLILLTGWRLVAYRGEMVSDFTDSGRAFGFFTFIAGTHVLGARLGMDGRYLLTGALLIVAVITWLVLGYIIPWTAVLSSSDRPVVALAHT